MSTGGGPKRPDCGSGAIVLGVAWYRREQWERLLEIASDREQLEDTFDEWQELAEETLRKLTKEGLTPRKVEVDVEELLKWCQEQGLPVDGKARSQFAVLKLQEQE